MYLTGDLVLYLLGGRRFLKEENETESLDLVSTYGAVIFQESIHEKQVKWESGK